MRIIVDDETIGCFSKPVASIPEAVKGLLGGIVKLFTSKDLDVALPDLYYKDLTANVQMRLVPARCTEAAQADPTVLAMISEILDAGVCKFNASVVDVDDPNIAIPIWDEDASMLDVSMSDIEADEDEDNDDNNNNSGDDNHYGFSTAEDDGGDDDDGTTDDNKDEGPVAPYLDLTSKAEVGFNLVSVRTQHCH